MHTRCHRSSILRLYLVLQLNGSVFSGNYFVSPSGDDSNDGSFQHPWKTIAYALCGGDYGCPCSEKNPNAPDNLDTLFIREGRYHEHHIIIRNSGVTIRNYPAEKPVMDADSAGSVFCLGRYGHGNSATTIRGITFINGLGACIAIGENFIVGNTIIDSCFFYDYIQFDNTAAVYLWPGARNTFIVNSTISGNRTHNLNYCGIQIFRGDGSVYIRNCDIRNVSSGIFYKHAGSAEKQTVIENNFIHDNLIYGAWISSNRVLIRNNLILNNNNGPDKSGTGISFWEDAGGTGGGYSRVEHNTIFGSGGGIAVNYGGQADWLTGDSGAMYDTIVNNIVCANYYNALSIWSYVTDTIKTHGTCTDYNCYFTKGNRLIGEFYDKAYTLPLWRLKYPGRDVHSSSEFPMFSSIGGPLKNIKDFELTGGAAKNGASDGNDMGADIRLLSKLFPSYTTVSAGGTLPEKLVFSAGPKVKIKNGNLNVMTKKPMRIHGRILDLSGKIMLTFDTGGEIGEYRVNCAFLKAGLYFIEYGSEGYAHVASFSILK